MMPHRVVEAKCSAAQDKQRWGIESDEYQAVNQAQISRGASTEAEGKPSTSRDLRIRPNPALGGQQQGVVQVARGFLKPYLLSSKSGSGRPGSVFRWNGSGEYWARRSMSTEFKVNQSKSNFAAGSGQKTIYSMMAAYAQDSVPFDGSIIAESEVPNKGVCSPQQDHFFRKIQKKRVSGDKASANFRLRKKQFIRKWTDSQ